MNLPTKSKIINGRNYEVTQLTMKKWLELKVVVIKMCGPSLGELLHSWTGTEDLNIDTRSVGYAIFSLSEKINSPDYEKILSILYNVSKVDNIELHGIAETWFPTHMKDFPEYLVFALEVQFADFFDGVMNAITGQSSRE